MTKPTEPHSSDRGFSKHITKIVVVLMILLMAFSFNFGGRAAREMASSGVTIGVTRDGTRVSSVDRQYAVRLLDTLESAEVVLRDQRAPLASACWGRDVVAAFKRSPEALWLVLEESRRAGPGASPLTLGPLDRDAQSTQDFGIFNSGLIWIDQLHPLPTSPLGSIPPQARSQSPISIVATNGDHRGTTSAITALPPLDQSSLYAALQDFLTIQSAASLTTSALKVSTPTVERLLAERFQQFSLSVALIDANKFADQVGEPTDAQVAGQFAQYAAFDAGKATKDSPFGFGYRVGDRVKLEWIALDRASIRTLVEAEKTPYQWDVETRVAYAKNSMAFASLAPTTQATTETTTRATTQAATAPTGFDAVKAGAITLHIARATDARLNEIERRIRSSLTSDYQAYSVAKTTNAATQPATSVGGAIDAVGYLDAIAADVGKKFKMTPPKVDHLTDVLRDRDAIAAASPSFAALSRPISFDPTQQVDAASDPAPAYAIRTATAAATRPSAPTDTAGALALFQPSETVSDATGDTTAIFRVVAAEPSRPGTDLEGVRARVVADWKVAQQQALAVKAASTSADAVRAGTLAVYNVPGAPGANVTIGPIAQSPKIPPELDLTPEGFAQFNEAFGTALLGGDPNGKPVGVLSVPIARRVYVAQRNGLRAGWTSPAELTQTRDGLRDALANAMSRPHDAMTNPFGLTAYTVGSAWLDVDRIFERTGWQANTTK